MQRLSVISSHIMAPINRTRNISVEIRKKERQQNMKNSILKTFAASSMLALMLIGSTVVHVAGQELRGTTSSQNPSADLSRRSIVGVWLTQLQGRNCSTGDPIGPLAPGLITFAKDGTLSETATIPMLPNPLPVPFFRSPGHGVWDRQNWENYTAAIVLQRLNADGTFAGRTRIRAAIQLLASGDDFTWTGSGEHAAPDGTVFATTCNTLTAVRFE
jgi:hypothetical protein